jgi:chromosome partitioning protein
VTKPSSSRAARSSSKPKPVSKRASKASGTQPTAVQRPSKASREAPETSGAARAASRRARIIAVANQKGGVGKSTTAVSLGASLAELGHRVLVVDLDPQGNASTGLGIRHEEREVTVYDVLADEAPIERAIVPTPIDNLFAIPSTIDLAGAEIELVSQFSRELRLRKAIEPLKHDAYDFVFLDCPPSLGLLTVNALAAAEELIVPIQCEYYALEGLGQLLRNVRLVPQNVNTGLRLTGIVMTMFDPRTKLSEQVVAEVRRYFGDRVYQTVIPRTVRLSEAPGFGQPITVYDPSSKGARSYRDLAREVAARLPDERPLPNVDDVPSVTIPRPEQPPSRAPRPLVEPESEAPPQKGEARAAAVEVEVAEPKAMPEEASEPVVPPEDAESDAPAAAGIEQASPHPAHEQEERVLAGDPLETQPAPRIQPSDPGSEPDGEVGQPLREVQPPELGDGQHDRAPEAEPTLDEGSRHEEPAVADMNGDQTQPEREDEMELEPRGAGAGRKRRRGLFRRGGS